MPTILDNLRQLFRDIKSRNQPVQAGRTAEMNGLFRFRYAQFKELLVANSELLNTLSEIDEKLKGESVFGITFIRKQANKALQQAFQMTKCLCVMSGGKYKELYSALERINLEIKTGRTKNRSGTRLGNAIRGDITQRC
jgi:pyruvate, water dikinase